MPWNPMGILSKASKKEQESMGNTRKGQEGFWESTLGDDFNDFFGPLGKWFNFDWNCSNGFHNQLGLNATLAFQTFQGR